MNDNFINGFEKQAKRGILKKVLTPATKAVKPAAAAPGFMDRAQSWAQANPKKTLGIAAGTAGVAGFAGGRMSKSDQPQVNVVK
jgi:hypothetical protein